MSDFVQHSKVYANERFMSNPPQQKWICSICGELGVDTMGGYTVGDPFWDLVEKFSNEKQDFIDGYCVRSGIAWADVSDRLMAVTCDCGEDGCKGWAMVCKDNYVHKWTGEYIAPNPSTE